MISTLLIILTSCREESDFLNNISDSSKTYNLTKENVETRILNKADFENCSFIKNAVNQFENVLKDKNSQLNSSSSSSSSEAKNSETLFGYQIYTNVSEEVKYLDATYTSFYILGSEDGYEEKLVLKSINQKVVEKYIIRYKRINGFAIDNSSYQTIKIEEPSEGNDNLVLLQTSFTMLCTTYTITSFDCGEGGHHSNGVKCPVLGIVMPYDVVTSSFDPDCLNNTGGGGGTSGGSGGGGGTSTGTTTPAVVTIPTTAPLYSTLRPKGARCNPLGLTEAEITQLNGNYDLRLKIYQYLWSRGLYPFSNNGCEDLGTEFGVEYVKYILQFFSNNPSISWDEFRSTKHDAEPNTSVDFENNESGNYDETLVTDFDFENQQVQWPTISNVIPVSDFVGWGTTGIRRNCMDYAKAQIAKKGYKISNYYDVDSQGNKQTFQIYTEQNGVNLTDLYKGVSYLKYALSNGIPVVVGIDDQSTQSPNLDQSTDHFVVIVGMGTDSNGRYFRFYDNASSDASQGAHSENKLYYKPAQKIFTGKTQCGGYRDNDTEYDYIMTMIRKSK